MANQETVTIEIPRSYLKYFKQLQGCSDGGCVIRRPRGMHTNGGCKCKTHLLNVYDDDMRKMVYGPAGSIIARVIGLVVAEADKEVD